MPIKQILIVDDSKSARLVLRKMLQGINLDVDMAVSGEEALEHLHDNLPDAIFMDQAMPGIDGLQTVKKIRENPRTEFIPIAMYTSREEDSFIEQLKTHDVVGILPKPADPDTLAKIVEKLNAAYEEAEKHIAEQSVSETVNFNAPEPGASIEVIEDIAQTTAESTIEKAIDNQIIPLLEKKMDQLREDLTSQIEVIAYDVAHQSYERRIKEFSNRQERQINAQITGLRTNLDLQIKMDQEEIKETQKKLNNLINQYPKEIEKTAEHKANNAANKICDKRIQEFSEKIINHLNQHIAKLKKNIEQPKEVSPEMLEELKKNLKPNLTQQINHSLRMQKDQLTNEVSSKIIQETDLSVQLIAKRIYLLAGLAAFIGVFSAALVYYLK